MYKEILVPLDGSKPAESILPYVRCLAEALKAPVQLLHVKDAKIKDSSQLLQEENYLKSVANSLLASLTVRYTVESGKPAEVIVNTAGRDPATLITMATRGQRRLLGSVVNRVLYAARNPLVLMRATSEKQTSDVVHLETIVVLLDGSPSAEKILPYVVHMAKALRLEVSLVRAYSLPRGSNTFAKRFYVPYTDKLAESVKERVKTYLEVTARELQAELISKVSYQLIKDGESVGMIKLAQNLPGKVLAMYTFRKSGFINFGVGNLPERFIRHSDNAVLVVPA